MHQKEDRIREDTRDFYNDIADKFSSTRNYWWQELNDIKKYLKGEERILDFGCGNGRLLELLQNTDNTSAEETLVPDASLKDTSEKSVPEIPLKNRYVGVDISSELIRHAQQKYPGFQFMSIDNEQLLPFEDGSFDVVFAVSVLHHFNPNMAGKSLKELRRVLKKDGLLVVSTWYLWNRKYLPFLLRSFLRGNMHLEGRVPFNNQRGIFWRYCYWWTQNKLARLVKDAGFDIMEAGYTRDKAGNKKNIILAAKLM